MPVHRLVVILFLLSPLALAHKVLGIAYSNGDSIEGEIGFSNGEMAKAGTIVSVRDKNGLEIQTATVDESGLFLFKPKILEELHLFADLHSGHQFRYVLQKDELPGAAVSDSEKASGSDAQEDGPLALSSSSALRLEVEAAVSRQTIPLRREIAELKEQTRWSDILGALGYIMGLTGLMAWYKSKKD